MTSLQVHIQLDDSIKGVEPVFLTLIKGALAHAYSHPDLCQNGPSVIGVSLMDDEAIAKLNHTYRDKDKPTNILSFPDGETEDEDGLYLGDLAISIPRLIEEALEIGSPIKHHLQHLSIHGFLHLLGYEHEEDEEAEAMEKLEIQLLNELGVKNPYQDTIEYGRI